MDLKELTQKITEYNKALREYLRLVELERIYLSLKKDTSDTK